MSSTSELDRQFGAFVSRQQKHAAAERSVDWQKEKKDWLRNLGELHALINQFLAEYVAKKAIEIEQSKVTLSEENIGSYEAPFLLIRIGAQKISVMPIGTLLIGSKGRVDVSGPRGKARLALVDKDMGDFRDRVRIRIVTEGSNQKTEPASPPKPIEWAWKILEAPPKTSFKELTKESFLQMLLDLSDA